MRHQHKLLDNYRLLYNHVTKSTDRKEPLRIFSWIYSYHSYSWYIFQYVPNINNCSIILCISLVLYNIVSHTYIRIYVRTCISLAPLKMWGVWHSHILPSLKLCTVCQISIKIYNVNAIWCIIFSFNTLSEPYR